MKGPSPLLGNNTNVRHRGRVFHVQTEDSGLKNPHVVTHLFADGGRIVATKKTSYAEHVGDEAYADAVKRLMQAQHKEMFIRLRNGEFDEEIGFDDAAPPSSAPRYESLQPTAAESAVSRATETPLALRPLDDVILAFLAGDDAL